MIKLDEGVWPNVLRQWDLEHKRVFYIARTGYVA